MKKIQLIILILLLTTVEAYGQCLCGKIQVQICMDNLSFENDNSNYELKINETSNRITKTLKKNDFLNDTLHLVYPTDDGIEKLVIELKNTILKSTMTITVMNMTYDNDYFIDLTEYTSGNYLFDWQKINTCQSENKTLKIVDCEGMEFEQLLLLSEKPMIGSFNHNKIKPVNLESFHEDEDTIRNIKIGTFQGNHLTYDCFGCKSSITDGITINITNNNIKTELISIEIADFYIDTVQLVELENHPFLYVHSTHTYGHSDGKLFSLDIDNKTINSVNVQKAKFVIPDSLSVQKGFGLSKDENNKFTTGYFLRSENNGSGYGITNSYKLKKINENQYELIPTGTELYESN